MNRVSAHPEYEFSGKDKDSKQIYSVLSLVLLI